MELQDLKLGDVALLINAFQGKNTESIEDNTTELNQGLNSMIGKKVIIRTYSAGVHFGTLSQKSGKEVILTNARRMYKFWCEKSISLTGVSLYGIKHDKSMICGAVNEIWLEAIEILPCTDIAIQSIESAKEVEAQ